MFCGKCGKEISESAKFCPYCGGENAAARPAVKRPAAVSPTPAPESTISVPDSAKLEKPAASGRKSRCRLVLIVLGALQAVMFFILPFAKLNGLGSFTAGLGGLFGVEMPKSLTSLNVIRLVKSCAALSGENAGVDTFFTAVIFGLPLVIGVLAAVMNLQGKARKSYLFTMVLEIVSLLAYFVGTFIIDSCEQLGYTMGVGICLAMLVAIVQIVTAIAGMITYKKLCNLGGNNNGIL